MKEGWTYRKLGEVCDILDSQRKPITKGKRESGSIPYYGATGCLDYVKDYIFDEKLVLLGEDGAKWGAGENSAYIIEGKSWVNNHAHTLRPKRELLVDELLVYYLNFSNLLIYITGVTVPKLNQEKMRSIEIPIGPVKEQQSIVDYLDSAFAKIDAMKANAEKALNEAKAFFQASLKEILEPKKGWEECLLIKEFTLKSGDYLSSKMQQTGVIPVYGGNGITGYHNIHNYDGSQLLIGRVGALCGNIHLTSGKIWVTDNAFVVKNIKNYWNIKFLKYEFGFLNLNQYASQSAQPVISNKSMRDVVIQKPPIREQQSIVTTLDSLKSKVDRLQENFDKISQECDALKQAILRQVFE